MSSSNTDSENSFEYEDSDGCYVSQYDIAFEDGDLNATRVTPSKAKKVWIALTRFMPIYALTKSTHFLRRLIASGRESPKKGMVCTNMPLEGSATLLQLAAIHLSGIFWTTFLLVSVHNHANQFPR